MNDEIKVHVVNYGRKNFYMRYLDPVTGKQVPRSTGKSIRREADRVAAKWEAELQEGRYKSPSKVGWAEFRIRYEDEVLPRLADKTAEKVWAIFNAVERHLKPEKLASLTAERISYLMSKMREAGRAETTIKSNMAHLKSSLNWGKRIGLLFEVPNIDMPRRAKGGKIMKGRPITGEAFERLLSKVSSVLFPEKRKKHTPKEPSPAERKSIVRSWKDLMVGLWWSGLRLEESLELYWDRDDRLCVDLSGKYPMLWIPAELEKGHQNRLLPIAPEFAEFLLATPEANRTGRVFDPKSVRYWQSKRLIPSSVGRIISDIGKASSVKVHTDPKTGKVKYASAHDLRRSFGERWAPRVMPQVLKELMRHETIETTLKYYVGRNAQNTAEALYAALGNTSGNTAPQAQSEATKENTESPEENKAFGK
jgi:integrase